MRRAEEAVEECRSPGLLRESATHRCPSQSIRKRTVPGGKRVLPPGMADSARAEPLISIPAMTTAEHGRIQRDWHLGTVQARLSQSAKRLVNTDYRTVEGWAARYIYRNVAGGTWGAVGGDRRPAFQIRGGLNDVIHVGLSGQRESKPTA